MERLVLLNDLLSAGGIVASCEDRHGQEAEAAGGMATLWGGQSSCRYGFYILLLVVAKELCRDCFNVMLWVKMDARAVFLVQYCPATPGALRVHGH